MTNPFALSEIVFVPAVNDMVVAVYVEPLEVSNCVSKVLLSLGVQGALLAAL